MQNKLFVYFNKILVGYLTKANGKLAFQYSQDYAKNPNSIALSLSLPIQDVKFTHAVTDAYFQGLLPEGHAKSVIAKNQKIKSSNTFALLELLGRDCAGSIEIYPLGIEPENTINQQFDYKNEDESYEILSSLQQRPLYFGEDDFRVSGAGAQDKLIACLYKELIALPLNGTPSTHIFKPEIIDLANSCHNEYFCMLLAKRIGFLVPEVKLLQIKDKIFYCVTRYDRFIDNDVTYRKHQEDFCQALGVLPDNKYQSDGGPSLKDCFELLKRIGVSGSDKIRFLDLVIYNYIIGNTDAHAKNFSILYENKQPNFAPCYDLMSTVIYAPHYPKAKMAMKLMSESYLISKVKSNNFAKLTKITGFREDFILKRLDNLCKKITDNAQALADELNQSALTQSSVYDKIIAVIDKHINIISQ